MSENNKRSQSILSKTAAKELIANRKKDTLRSCKGLKVFCIGWAIEIYSVVNGERHIQPVNFYLNNDNRNKTVLFMSAVYYLYNLLKKELELEDILRMEDKDIMVNFKENFITAYNKNTKQSVMLNKFQDFEPFDIFRTTEYIAKLGVLLFYPLLSGTRDRRDFEQLFMKYVCEDTEEFTTLDLLVKPELNEDFYRVCINLDMDRKCKIYKILVGFPLLDNKEFYLNTFRKKVMRDEDYFHDNPLQWVMKPCKSDLLDNKNAKDKACIFEKEELNNNENYKEISDRKALEKESRKLYKKMRENTILKFKNAKPIKLKDLGLKDAQNNEEEARQFETYVRQDNRCDKPKNKPKRIHIPIIYDDGENSKEKEINTGFNFENDNIRSNTNIPNGERSIGEILCKGFNLIKRSNINHLLIIVIVLLLMPRIQIVSGQAWNADKCVYQDANINGGQYVSSIFDYKDALCFQINNDVGAFFIKMEFTSPTNYKKLDEPIYSLDYHKNYFFGKGSNDYKSYSCGCLSQPKAIKCTIGKQIECNNTIADGTKCRLCTIGETSRPDNGCPTLYKKNVLTLVKSETEFIVEEAWNTNSGKINIYNINVKVWDLNDLSTTSDQIGYSGVVEGSTIYIPTTVSGGGAGMNNELIVKRLRNSNNFQEELFLFDWNNKFENLDEVYMIPKEEIEFCNPQKFLNLLIDRDGGIDKLRNCFTEEMIERTKHVKCYGNDANQYPHFRSLNELKTSSYKLKLKDNSNVVDLYRNGNVIHLTYKDMNLFELNAVSKMNLVSGILPVGWSITYHNMTCDELNIWNDGVKCKVKFNLVFPSGWNYGVNVLVNINGEVVTNEFITNGINEIDIIVDDDIPSDTNFICLSLQGLNVVNCGTSKIVINNKTLDDPDALEDDKNQNDVETDKGVSYQKDSNILAAILTPVLVVVAIILILIIVMVVKKKNMSLRESFEMWRWEMDEKREMKRIKKAEDMEKMREKFRRSKSSKEPLMQEINKKPNRSNKINYLDDMDTI